MKKLALILLLLTAPLALRAQRPQSASTTVSTQNGLLQSSTTSAATTGAAAPGARSAAPRYNDSRLFVKFRAGVRAFLPGTANVRGFSHDANVFLVDTPPGLSVAAAMAQYKATAGVVYAEPDYEVNIVATTPNDPQWVNQWDMAKISAPTMWDTQKAALDVVVAVVDTGINETHPDLLGNVLAGWNCVGAANINPNTSQPYGCVAGQIDDHGHGTHVAGTIGAVGGNGVGIAGINWSAKIMAFKFLNSGGSGSLSDAIYAFNKIAALQQAGTNFRVTNNSWGGGGYSQTLKDAMAAVENLGIVNVCAAGNSGLNADLDPMYPGGYDNRGIVSVLATDSGDLGAGFTNYGLANVDIAAPGVNTLSTSPFGTCSLCVTTSDPATWYKYLSGTSMASPHVAGAMAAMLQRNFNLHAATPATVPLITSAATARDIILDPASYDVMTDAKAKSTSTGGRLNLAKLLANPMLSNPPAQLNQFPTVTVGANIFAGSNQQVTISASASDPDAADNANLRFSWGNANGFSWLFGTMQSQLFPTPVGNPSTFTTPNLGRTTLQGYVASATDNRGGGATGAQYVTVSPVASTLGGPTGNFSACKTGTATCVSDASTPLNVTRDPVSGYVDVTLNYAPVDPDNKGTPLWDSFYASRGSAGGSCCYSGTAMTWRFSGAGVFRMSVNAMDRYLEGSPMTAATRKTAIVSVDGATGVPPIGAGTVTPLSGPVGTNFTVDLSGSIDPDGSIPTYFISCGEGFLTSQATPTRTCNFATPGTYWLESFVQDNSGLWDVVNLYVVVTPPNGGGGDTTGPSVSAPGISPTSGGFVKGQTTVSTTANDNAGGSGMKDVKFYLDSLSTLIGTATGAGPSFSVNWNSSAATNGAHTLFAVATDNSTNATTSASTAISVDNGAPTVSISSPTGTVAGTVAINANATDNGPAGIANVVFCLDNTASGCTLGSDSTSPYSVNWNSTGVSDDAHTLYAIATDNAGNSTTSAGQSVTVNNTITPPAIGSLNFSPAPAKKTNVTITATNVSSGATITKVDFYINGVVVGTDASSPYTYLWKVPAAGGRTYTVYAVVTDSLGRTATSSSYSFTM